MNVTYACPGCHGTVRSEFDASTRSLECTYCGREIATPKGAVTNNRVQRCLVCPSTDLFVRKDFPQKLGALIVAVGIIGSSIAWYEGNLWWTFGILFGSAVIDVVLFAFVGDAVMCYRCEAEYRGVAEMDSYQLFDLETHERYRQMAARMKMARGHSSHE